MSENQMQGESTSPKATMEMTEDNDDPKDIDDPKDNDDPNDQLTTLPDVPLLRIVSDLSLQQSFSMLEVHTRFQLICGSIFASKQRLALYIGDLDDITVHKFNLKLRIPFEAHLVDSTGKLIHPEPDRLHFATLDSEIVNKLVSLIPSISHLEVAFNQVNSFLIDHFTSLLTHLAPSLKTLKFTSGPFQEAEDSQNLRNLITLLSMNASVLEHLTLEIDGELFGSDAVPLPVNLSLLGRLKEFYWATTDYRHSAFIIDFLRRPECKQLTSIGIAAPYEWEAYKDALSDHPLADRFKILLSQHKPPELLATMPNLEMFTASWQRKESLNLITQQLSGLTQLKCLTLLILQPRPEDYDRFCEGRVDDLHDDPDEPQQVHALPSVKILRIVHNNRKYNHRVVDRCFLEAFFPSVQIVFFIHMGKRCTLCFRDETDDPSKLYESGFKDADSHWCCLHPLLHPLAKFPLVRKIFYQRNHDVKNIGKFNPKIWL